jgi:arylsulfatase A-like enzyme
MSARASNSAQPATGTSRRTFLRDGARAGAALTAASLGGGAASALASRPARRVGAPPRRHRPPNILVVMVDQLRTPRWYGAQKRGVTLPPNIAALARSGVSFARHYTASNDCSPARAALVTGLHTHQTGAMITGATTLDPTFPTWGSMLREHGYATYWYGKWHLTHGDHHWNFVDGPVDLDRYGFAGGTYPSPDGAPGQGWLADPMIVGQFEQWYREEAGGEPWCTTVSLVNPHDIAWWWRWSHHCVAERRAPHRVGALPPNFETPQQLRARHKPRLQLSLQDTSAHSFGQVRFSGPRARAQWLAFADLYVMLQRTVDDHLGRVLGVLASRRRVLENTIVLFTSDHGEYGSSHGLRGKGAGLYEEGINVPLIVTDFTGRLGAVPNTVRHQLSSSVDVAPLLLTLAGGSNEWRREARYGQLAHRPDLAAVVRDPAVAGREYALHATDEVATEFALEAYAADAPRHVTGIITAKAKYATYSDWRKGTIEPLSRGQEAELYDYTTRSGYLELDNVAGRSQLEQRMRSKLERAIRDELQAPLPPALDAARSAGLANYRQASDFLRRVSQFDRLRSVQQVAEHVMDALPIRPGVRARRAARRS